MKLCNSALIVCCALLVLGCQDAPPASESTQPPTPAGQPAEPVTNVLMPETLAEEDEKSPGIAVGEDAPAFELQDQAGNVRKLSEFLANGNVALVFYRSADW